MKNKLFTLFVGFLLAFGAKAEESNEKLLVNETFQSWEAIASSTTETTVNKITNFSNETLAYKLKEILVSPTGWDATRFDETIASKGYLMAAKSATSYIELSPLASITKVEFVHGATGGSRGYKLSKKVGNGEWEVVSATYATNAKGTKVTVDINSENVALKFENLNSAQNAYLFDLRIYGNYASTQPQVNLTTSANIAEAGSISRSINSDTYDKGTTLTLTATTNFGYKFVKWIDGSNNTLSTEKNLEITLDGDKNITAVFEALTTYSFNVTVEGSQWGKVNLSPEPTNGKYEAGSIVTVSVVSNPVTTFSYWENQTSETTRIIQVNSNTEISATFDEIPFIVGWDFKAQEPRIARKADYYSESNNTGVMNAYKTDGTTIAWLANVGSFSPSYPCIRKWATDFVNDQRYYQTSFSTIGYKNIKVTSMMSGNYQMYAKQTMQYSIDGSEFNDLTTIDLTNAYNSTWVDCNAALPANAEGLEKVYIRWIADKTSDVLGTGNDGTALTNVFIFADKEIIPVLDPPILISTTPAEGSATASANGSIVLTFDKKVKTGTGNITLNGETIVGIFGSKTATFKYSKLSYNTTYTLVVPAGALQDMSGNAFEGINLSFTTMNRPQPIAKIFDAVIAADNSGDFTTIQDAINAAPSNAVSPYIIFVKNGKYVGHVEIPVTKPNIHLIGQSRDNVIISDNRLSGDAGDGTPVYHVSLGATVVINAANCYFENITFDNSWGYEKKAGPQALAMYANNDKIVFKNCSMRSYQDTYLTSTRNIADRQYLEKCYIEGAVDYIYGGGDVFFEECTLFNNRFSGGYIVAPNHQTGTAWGYVFNNCTLDGDKGTTVYLGRPWHNSPKTIFLNTKSLIDIYASGWYYKMGAIPAIFADYGTTDANGNPVDLNQRIEDYEYTASDGSIVTGKAKKSLTDSEAAQYTLTNVMKGSDDWDPRTATEATETPIIYVQGSTVSWSSVDYAICYAIIKNGNVVDFTTNTEYPLPTTLRTLENDKYSVIAVAESGALSSISNEVSISNTTGMKPIEIDLDKITHYVSNNSLYINNLPENAIVQLYDFEGRLMVSTTNNIIPISQNVIVRIKSNNEIRVFKIMI